MSIVKDGILYHNVEELEKTTLGDKLYRLPREVRPNINALARFKAQFVCGCELRFVTESERIHINLTAQCPGLILATIYKGDYIHSVMHIESGKNTILELNKRKISESAKKIFFADKGFSENVWRVHLHNCLCTVHSINTMDYPVRAPYKDEMPEKTMLAYGSSITQGAVSINHTSSYAEEAAYILGVDILNKGGAGACHYEPEIADFFAKDDSWDFAFIEGAVNCTHMTTEEFDKRFSYFIDTLYKTGKKIFMTTILPAEELLDDSCENYEKMHQFNEIIRSKSDKGVVIEGKNILTDLRFLTMDFLHPSTEGHARMGINLANILKEYL